LFASLGKKCKVLEIIPINMEGERCEIITSICLRLFLGVTQRDATTEMHAKTLKITNEFQTDVEVGVPNYPKEGHDKSCGTQDNLPPPKVNQLNTGIVRHTKKKGNASTMKENKVLSKQKWNMHYFKARKIVLRLKKRFKLVLNYKPL